MSYVHPGHALQVAYTCALMYPYWLVGILNLNFFSFTEHSFGCHRLAFRLTELVLKASLWQLKLCSVKEKNFKFKILINRMINMASWSLPYLHAHVNISNAHMYSLSLDLPPLQILEYPQVIPCFLQQSCHYFSNNLSVQCISSMAFILSGWLIITGNYGSSF